MHETGVELKIIAKKTNSRIQNNLFFKSVKRETVNSSLTTFIL